MTVPLQTPRPAQELTREFAIKGGLRLVLDEVLYPVRIISDRPRKFAMGQVGLAAGGAGLRSEVVLTNALDLPVDQDSTFLIHKIWVQSNVAAEANLCWPTAAVLGLTAITDKRFLDGDLEGAPLANFGQDNTAAATGAVVFAQVHLVANAESTLIDFTDSPIIVRPVNSFIVRPSADNTLLVVTLLWSEPADPA